MQIIISKVVWYNLQLFIFFLCWFPIQYYFFYLQNHLHHLKIYIFFNLNLVYLNYHSKILIINCYPVYYYDEQFLIVLFQNLITHNPNSFEQLHFTSWFDPISIFHFSYFKLPLIHFSQFFHLFQNIYSNYNRFKFINLIVSLNTFQHSSLFIFWHLLKHFLKWFCWMNFWMKAFENLHLYHHQSIVCEEEIAS